MRFDRKNLRAAIASLLALVLTSAVLLLAIRSDNMADVLTFRVGQRFGTLKSELGLLELSWRYLPSGDVSEYTRDVRWYDNYDCLRHINRNRWRLDDWFRFAHGQTIDSAQLGGMTYTTIVVPHWLFMTLSAAAALWFGRKVLVGSWRLREGLCRTCGYDLRASLDRCPECGTPTTPATLRPAEA